MVVCIYLPKTIVYFVSVPARSFWILAYSAPYKITAEGDAGYQSESAPPAMEYPRGSECPDGQITASLEPQPLLSTIRIQLTPRLLWSPLVAYQR